MKITIDISNAIIGNWEIQNIIGSRIESSIDGIGIEISGQITEIIDDDGTIINSQNLTSNSINANRSLAREGIAPRGSLIPSQTP